VQYGGLIRAARRYLLAASGVAALALFAAGCGGGGGGGDDSGPVATAPAETIDAPAPPFPGGVTLINTDGGYTVGVPHGWAPERQGGVTVLTSPDHVVTVAVTSDRTGEALATPPAAIARAAIESLPDFTNIRGAGGAPFKAHYPAVKATGTATREADNLRQAFRSFVLVRPNLAVFTVLASRGAKTHSPFASQVDAIVRSVRGRPVTVS
jgi:hypothetical protein